MQLGKNNAFSDTTLELWSLCVKMHFWNSDLFFFRFVVMSERQIKISQSALLAFWALLSNISSFSISWGIILLTWLYPIFGTFSYIKPKLNCRKFYKHDNSWNYLIILMVIVLSISMDHFWFWVCFINRIFAIFRKDQNAWYNSWR